MLSEAQVVMNGDTLQPDNRGRVEVEIKRSKRDTSFSLIRDSTKMDYRLESSLGGAYHYNLLSPYLIGYIVDWTRDVRYSYPSRVYVDIENNRPTYKRYSPWQKKGDINLRLGLPFFNQYQWNVDGYGDLSGRGFYGMSAGFDYFYSDNQFATFNISTQTTYPSVFPLIFSRSRVAANMNSLHLMNGHQVGMWSFQYGVAFTQKEFTRYIDDGSDPWFSDPRVERTEYDCIGLVGQAHMRLYRTLHIGFILQPTFIRIGQAESTLLEHNFTLDVSWRIPLYESRRY